METKKCCHCKEEKSIDDFDIKDKRKGNLNSRCLICNKKYKDDYYHKNKEKISQQAKLKKRKKTPEQIERIREYQKKYYQKNRDKLREYGIAYSKKNKEKAREYNRNFYAKHGRKKKVAEE